MHNSCRFAALPSLTVITSCGRKNKRNSQADPSAKHSAATLPKLLPASSGRLVQAAPRMLFPSPPDSKGMTGYGVSRLVLVLVSTQDIWLFHVPVFILSPQKLVIRDGRHQITMEFQSDVRAVRKPTASHANSGISLIKLGLQPIYRHANCHQHQFRGKAIVGYADAIQPRFYSARYFGQ